MDCRQDLKLPAGASTQIAGDTRQARADRSWARQIELCQNRHGVHYLPGRGQASNALTLALPVLFLVIFASVFTGTTKVAGVSIATSLCYVPVIITLAIISAASGNLGPRPGPLLLHT
jgi:hypothetical protein